jgi:hypothetical protein
MLHQADGGKGWRNFFRRQSLSYRTTDMCAITELGRDGPDGPLRAIYHVDSSRCRWTGNEDEPLQYNPGTGPQLWSESDFFNVASMPNPQENFNGLGYCQTSRAWDLLRLFYGVLMHDQELVGARMPKGIMFLHNVTEGQWDTMLRGRDAQMDGKNALYLGGLMVIASMGDETPDGKLVAFSQLPANFSRETFIDQTMYGYALVSGYDPSEFWPVSGGTLGSGKETEQQHRKAIGKGAMEFPQGWQDRFQQQLPPALLFQFEERDAEGELIDATVAQAWANVAKTLYEAGLPAALPLLDQQAVLKILADNSRILSPDDVMIMQEAVATDEETTEITERAMNTPQVLRAIERYPSEPIVKYTWPVGVERVLWERGDDALKPRVWPRPEFKERLRQELLDEVERQDEPDVLYESPDGDVVITGADVAGGRGDRMTRRSVYVYGKDGLNGCVFSLSHPASFDEWLFVADRSQLTKDEVVELEKSGIAVRVYGPDRDIFGEFYHTDDEIILRTLQNLEDCGYCPGIGDYVYSKGWASENEQTEHSGHQYGDITPEGRAMLERLKAEALEVEEIT